MISNETVETFAKEMMDELCRRGVRRDYWKATTEQHREAYKQAAKKAFRSIGVKSEGDDEEEVF